MRPLLLAMVVISALVISCNDALVVTAQTPASPDVGGAVDGGVPDLTEFPVMDDAKLNQQSRAKLRYEISRPVREAFQFQIKELSDRGWKKLEGSYESDASCSASLERNGYKISASVYSTGGDDKAMVTLMQHGNVDLSELPLPPDMKPIFEGPVSAGFLTESPVDATQKACRQLLAEDGWEPYGVAGDSLIFRKNTTLLTAFISAAAAQGGKTMAQFSTELISADIPLFPGATNAQYSDGPTQLFFDSGKSMEDVVDYYKQTLAKSGWKPTTDALVKVSIYDVLIFRNPEGDMMELRLHNFEGQARALVRYSTAAEVAKLDALAKQKAGQRMAKKTQADDFDVLEVVIPADAKEVDIQADSIEFQLPSGSAKKLVEGWMKAYVQDGWKAEASVLESVAGTVLLVDGSKTLTIAYTDVGFMPAEVSVDAIGVKLRRSAP